MNQNELRENIIKTERDYPSEFSKRVRKSYGELCYNDEQKGFNLANRGILYPEKITDLRLTLENVRQFYLNKGIAPRLFQSFSDGFMMENSLIFRSSGFDILTRGTIKVMLLTEKSVIEMKEDLDIREVDEWDERLAFDIFIPNNNFQSLTEIKRNVENPKCRVFVAYKDDRAVSAASLYMGDHGVATINFLETAEEIRGRGYARELVSEMIKPYRNSTVPLYLMPYNSTSEKLAFDAGFREVFRTELSQAVYTIKET